MACENPLTLRNPRYKKMTSKEVYLYSKEFFGEPVPPDLYIEVGCGQCHGCEKRRMRDYQIRLLYELNKHPNSYFITLTFDDKNLKRFEDAPNESLKLFLDRLRKECFNKQVKHWFVAEYGTLHGRLHYHGFLFDLPYNNPTDVAHLILSKWQYGFTDAQKCDENASRYVTKYVTKSCNNGKKPPRIFSSVGIGTGYLDPDNIRFHNYGGILRPYILYRGLKVPLPRYYHNKIFSDMDKIQMLREREEMRCTEPLMWNGKAYYNLVDFNIVRRATFEKNVRLGLSKRYKSQSNNKLNLSKHEFFKNSAGL